MSKLEAWASSHQCTITYEGAIGGKYTYMFAPTSLGMVTKVECACGAIIDVTDYNDW